MSHRPKDVGGALAWCERRVMRIAARVPGDGSYRYAFAVSCACHAYLYDDRPGAWPIFGTRPAERNGIVLSYAVVSLLSHFDDMGGSGGSARARALSFLVCAKVLLFAFLFGNSASPADADHHPWIHMASCCLMLLASTVSVVLHAEVVRRSGRPVLRKLACVTGFVALWIWVRGGAVSLPWRRDVVVTVLESLVLQQSIT